MNKKFNKKIVHNISVQSYACTSCSCPCSCSCDTGSWTSYDSRTSSARGNRFDSGRNNQVA